MTTVQEWIAQGGVRKEDYAFTVRRGDVAWDVYHFHKDDKAGTMAYRKDGDRWIIDVFCAGHLDRDAVLAKIQSGLD